jgi:hypothetical protein
VAYVDQFDNLVREQDRGHPVRFTRTIAVFTDGLAVCPVPVAGGSPVLQRGVISRLLGRSLAGRVGTQQVRDAALALGSGGTAGGFAPTWHGAQAIPFAVVERIVLARPQQVSWLEIYEAAGGDGGTSQTVYLGDLAPDRVRAVLGPLLGERLQIDVVA